MPTIIKKINNIQNIYNKISITKSFKTLQKDDLNLSKGSVSSKKTYILEGATIKVYITDENGNQKCVQQIALSAAPLSILLQVQVTNACDAILLEEAIQKLLGSDEPTSNYDSSGNIPDFNKF